MDRQQRYPLEVPILLPARLPATTVDLGERGLGFSSTERYQPGEQLKIRLLLPSAQPLTLWAQIVWCKRDTAGQAFRYGARLRAIGLHESLVLKDYLAGLEAA